MKDKGVSSVTPFKVLVLDVDGVYRVQSSLLLHVDFFLDLRDFRGIRYMCSPEKLKDLLKILPNFGRTIAFLGGGECHHLSLLFLKRQTVPFTLVVLDSHFDFREETNTIRCDSWLTHVLSSKKVKKVIVVGCKEYVGKRPRFFFVNPSFEAFRKLVKGEWIYVSVDKDILKDNPTKWEGGSWSFEEIVNVLKSLPKRRTLGVDVCGEPVPYDLIKLKESERLNLAILEIFLSPPHLSSRALQVIPSR